MTTERRQWSVCVEIHISPVVEAESADHAADIVASMNYPLGEEILQRIKDGNYEIFAIETEGEVP